MRLALTAFCVCLAVSQIATAADSAKPALIPVEPEVIAAREKSLNQAAPEGGKLVAYLDCGSQAESTTTDETKITWVPSSVYQFKSEAEGVPPTQSTVFFDANRVEFQLAGLDRAHRYVVGLTWWDYDAGGRTQMVVVGSPDQRRVRIAVPAIGLPNYEISKQPPAEKRFNLPVTFAKDGRMSLIVQLATGANVVISELWIWQVD